ncbi:MAG: helix-turn-helix domain-containing protein [Candidatus Diapherotrites archaeon]
MSFLDKTVDFKILGYFFSFPLKEFFVKELSRKLKISSSSASNICKQLKKEKLLSSKTHGNLLLYKLNRDNPQVLELGKIFLLKKLNKIGFVEKFLAEDHEIISLAIYGSFVQANNAEKSDLDLLVITASEKNFSLISDKLSSKLRVEVKPTAFKPIEWKKLAKNKDPFYLQVINAHLLLYGNKLVI